MSLVSRFTSVARANPNSIACIFNSETLSYAELDRCSSKLAQILKDLGVAVSSKVALSQMPGFHRIISIFGILKTGASYIPLEPDSPTARKESILQQCNARFLISDVYSKLDSFIGVQFEFTDWKSTLRDAENSSSGEIGSSSLLAYTIFTSGSTGQPKGVEVTHSAILSVLDRMTERLELTSSCRFLSLASFAFDMSVPDIFLPLILGGSLVLTGEGFRTAPNEIATLVQRREVTHLQTVPGFLRILLVHSGQALHGLNVICGGENFGLDLVRASHHAGARIWNFYGPTEASVWSYCGEVDEGSSCLELGLPLVGHGYVLDDMLARVSPGGAGQLFLSGDHLALGYCNSAAATASKFLPDPFDRSIGGRMYATGDWVTLNQDGSLVFLGRDDSQVKLGGFRIELGELESLLLQVEGVTDALAVLIQADTGPFLAAMVQAPAQEEEKEVLVASSFAHLRLRLPSYMIPTVILVSSEIPYTENGKRDIREVQRKVAGALQLTEQVLAQGLSPTERLLTNLICAQMGTALPVNGDLFGQHGFSSLQAIRLRISVELEFSVKFDLVEIHRLKSIREISTKIDKLLSSSDAGS